MYTSIHEPSTSNTKKTWCCNHNRTLEIIETLIPLFHTTAVPFLGCSFPKNYHPAVPLLQKSRPLNTMMPTELWDATSDSTLHKVPHSHIVWMGLSEPLDVVFGNTLLLTSQGCQFFVSEENWLIYTLWASSKVYFLTTTANWTFWNLKKKKKVENTKS